MTTPEIRTDHAAVATVAAELRRIAAELPDVTAAVTDAVAAAAAAPVPAGVRPSPAMAAVSDAATTLAATLRETQQQLAATAATVTGWEGGLGEIQQDGATDVRAQGGGGSW